MLFDDFFPKKVKINHCKDCSLKRLHILHKKILNPTISWMHNSQSHKQKKSPLCQNKTKQNKITTLANNIMQIIKVYFSQINSLVLYQSLLGKYIVCMIYINMVMA
jgi:hypothetical protein